MLSVQINDIDVFHIAIVEKLPAILFRRAWNSHRRSAVAAEMSWHRDHFCVDAIYFQQTFYANRVAY
jgi:hypothetical protein